MNAVEQEKFFVCLETRSPLSPASPAMLEKLNQQANEGQLVNEMGKAVSGSIEAGLVNHQKSRFYVVRNGIPQLVLAESIPLQ